MKKMHFVFIAMLLVAGNWSHAYVVRFCGDNEDGQQGFADKTARHVAMPNRLMLDVKKVACGNHHTLILTMNGDVYACGDNTYGQLGVGAAYPSTTSPYKITGLENIVDIAAGMFHSLFLDQYGAGWACGRNDSGQLGLNDTDNRFLPVKTIIGSAVEIDCGGLFSAARSADGTVKVTGYNGYGQLGQGDTVSRSSWAPISADFSSAVGISCGRDHFMFIASGGAVAACGRNQYGQLGTGDNTQRTTPVHLTNGYTSAKQITCGDYHTLILEGDGGVRACGYNGYGQLGLNHISSLNLFTSVPDTAGKCVEVIAGADQSFIRLGDGQLQASGRNTKYELGLGDTNNHLHFTKVPGAWTCLTMDTASHNSSFVTTPSTAPNDFDGDGRTDIAVYWPVTGDWYIQQSGNGQMYSGGPVSWGWSDAVPATGDFDGDGFADISVFHRADSTYYIDYSSGSPDTVSFHTARQAVVGDYDGDGITDIGVYNGETGVWQIKLSSGYTRSLGWGWGEVRPIGLQD